MAVHHARSPPPPSPRTKVTTAGKNEVHDRDNLAGPVSVHKLLGRTSLILVPFGLMLMG